MILKYNSNIEALINFKNIFAYFIFSSPLNNSDIDSFVVKLKTSETVCIKLKSILFDKPRQLSIFNNSSETFLIDNIDNFSLFSLGKSLFFIKSITEFKLFINFDSANVFGGISKFFFKNCFRIFFAPSIFF